MKRAENPELRRIVRRMASGEAIDWGSASEGAAALASTLENLRVVEAMSRLAQEERRAILELTQAPGGAVPAAAPAADRFDRAWGPLRLLEKIGEGSYGEVFRAHDPALRTDVALKLWFPRFGADADVEAFLEEARTLARIRHPNVLAVLGAARHDGRVGMWTELLRGETLEAMIAERGLFGAAEAALIGAELCRALAAVHGAGLVHRDVKTRNVMRAEGGRIVLMDFGSVADASRLASSADAFRVGTPLAMAPEQVAGGPLGAAVDLYALGVLLYRLVSGRYPIEASSLEELEAAHARGERTPLRDRRPDLPFEFIEIVEKALASNPAARHPSAGAFEQALMRFVQAQGRPSRTTSVAGEGVETKRNNLQIPLGPFIGRGREIAECRRLLERSRLLTLTGVGGCGKTRLALRLAEGYLDGDAEGVWFVDLAPLGDPGRVVQTIARTLDVPEERGRALIESIAAELGARPSLLVVDNCEHLLESVAGAAMALLKDCPRLSIIATSREVLGVPGEATFAVPSLALPESDAKSVEEIGRAEAVQWFLACATSARPDFALVNENAGAVAEICRRLDGIPLAIELAAARIRVLAPEEILARLDQRFRLLTGGSKWALPRHRTLLETLAWSYDLLTEEERTLLRGLGVFAGGWTLETAQEVCADGEDAFAILDLLTRLVDKSLVVVERGPGGGSRYRMLETVRQFALEKLGASAEAERIRERHRDAFVRFAEARSPELQDGPTLAGALASCDAEHENVLAALAACDRGDDGPEKALRIVGSIFPYWTHRGLFSLGFDQVSRALARPASEGPTLERARATFAAALFSFYRGEYAETRRHGETSLAWFRALGFKLGVVWSLNAVANARLLEGDFEGARACYQDGLVVAREIAYEPGVAIALNNLANLASEADDPATALPLFRESAQIHRANHNTVSLGLSLANLAEAHVRLGEAEAGRSALTEGLEIVRETRRRDYGGFAITVAGLMAEALGSATLAARLLGAAEAVREVIGVPLQPSERRAQEAATARLRDRLGAAAFDAAWEDGQESSFEAAVDRALEWLRAERPASER